MTSKSGGRNGTMSLPLQKVGETSPTLSDAPAGIENQLKYVNTFIFVIFYQENTCFKRDYIRSPNMYSVSKRIRHGVSKFYGDAKRQITAFII